MGGGGDGVLRTQSADAYIGDYIREYYRDCVLRYLLGG